VYYKYYDTASKSVNFEGMKEDISNAEDGSVFMLHACAHNPTGIINRLGALAEVIICYCCIVRLRSNQVSVGRAVSSDAEEEPSGVFRLRISRVRQW